ncbi:MAG: DUF6599 family protein [Terriglobia bacterium]
MKRTGLRTRDSGWGIRDIRFGIILLAALVVLNLACSSKPTPTASEPFPSSGDATGWVKTGEARTFAGENLWEYIDGDADRYLQSGIVRTLTADYRFQNKIDAVADVHIFKGADGPKALMAAESAEGSRPASVGDEARLFASSLVFRKGPWLVRVTAYEEAPEIAKGLVALGQAIEKKLEKP